jgi:hypothetical protein
MGQLSNVGHNLSDTFANLTLPKILPENDSRIFVAGREEHLSERRYTYKKKQIQT